MTFASAGSVRAVDYRVTVKPIERAVPRAAALDPDRTSITYEPARSLDSRLRLRSVTRYRPLLRGARVVTYRARPVFLPLRAL
jgi:hypothetical protein